MKRIFLLFAFILVSSSYANAETRKRQGWPDSIPLYGDVESITITNYNIEDKFGEIVRSGINGRFEYWFNENGDVIKEAKYKSDGTLKYKNVYKYNSSGNKIEEAEYYDGALCSTIYKYDSSGHKIEATTYTPDGALYSNTIYKYDSSGNKIEEAKYYDGALYVKYIYKYDSLGNLIEYTEYKSDILLPKYLFVVEITYRDK